MQCQFVASAPTPSPRLYQLQPPYQRPPQYEPVPCWVALISDIGPLPPADFNTTKAVYGAVLGMGVARLKPSLDADRVRTMAWPLRAFLTNSGAPVGLAMLANGPRSSHRLEMMSLPSVLAAHHPFNDGRVSKSIGVPTAKPKPYLLLNVCVAFFTTASNRASPQNRISAMSRFAGNKSSTLRPPMLLKSPM